MTFTVGPGPGKLGPGPARKIIIYQPGPDPGLQVSGRNRPGPQNIIEARARSQPGPAHGLQAGPRAEARPVQDPSPKRCQMVIFIGPLYLKKNIFRITQAEDLGFGQLGQHIVNVWHLEVVSSQRLI